jgi:hypothetical protein
MWWNAVECGGMRREAFTDSADRTVVEFVGAGGATYLKRQPKIGF